MTNPVTELRKLVRVKSGPRTGKVSVVSPELLTVVTPKGTTNVAHFGATTYKVGDTVRVQNGIAIGRITDEQSLPVYHV